MKPTRNLKWFRERIGNEVYAVSPTPKGPIVIIGDEHADLLHSMQEGAGFRFSDNP
jgi:monoamine oxidase